jgi:hypothetical protein
MVVKVDGTRVAYDPKKVERTLRRYNTPLKLVKRISQDISDRVKDGTTTRQIFQWIEEELDQNQPRLRVRRNLREALAMIPPAPAFEKYIQGLLKLEGYQILPNRILKGKCGEHEVDGIIQNKNARMFLEIKHHYAHHTLTGLDVPRIAYAILMDLQEGYNSGRQKNWYSGAIIICNTKLSPHAQRYSKCKNIQHIGWKSPRNRNLERLVTRHKYYPITILQNLRRQHLHVLVNNGILTLQTLIETPIDLLKANTRISKRLIQTYKDEAKKIYSK